MALPKSVQNQAKAAAQHFEKPDENPEDTVNDPIPAPDPEQKAGDDPQASDTPPTEGKQPATPPKDEPKDADRDAMYWRHRHDVIQGKYNKEVPALHAEVKQLKQTLADKDQEITALNQSATSGNSGNSSDLTDEQIAEFRDTFGEELVDFVQRMMARNKPETPSNDVENLRNDVEQMKQERLDHQRAMFWVDLERAVPNYVEINNDQGFLQFLGTPIPNGGYTDDGRPATYQDRLNEAANRLDAKGVADVFKLHLHQATPANEPRRDVPEQDVTPRAARATEPAPQGRGQKQWSGAEIKQFYTDKVAGRYSAEQAQRLEADIFAAQAEGRVTR